MYFRKILNLFLLLSTVLTLSACGDFGEDKSETAPLTDERFNANCKISSDDLSYILKKEIPGALACLEKQLDIFINVVFSDRPGFLSQKELEDFIRTRNVVDNPEDVLKVMDAVFSISNLLFGGTPGYIHKDNLKALSSFATQLNKKAVKVYQLFEDDSDGIYANHRILRLDISKTAGELQQLLLNLFVNRSDSDTLDLVDVIDSIGSSSSETKEKVKDFLFIKRYFVGGLSRVLTSGELRVVINKLQTVAEVMYDFTRMDNLIFNDEVDRYELFSENFIKLRELMYFSPDGLDSIFTVSDAINAMKWFEEDLDLNISEYGELVTLVKEMLLGSNEHFTPQDFVKLEKMLRYTFSMGRYFMYMYRDNMDELDKTDRLSMSFLDYSPGYDIELENIEQKVKDLELELKNPDLPITRVREIENLLVDYRLQFRNTEYMAKYDHEYKTRFDRIVRDYRYFTKSGEDMPTFTNGFHRSGSGAFIIGAIEYALGYIFDYMEAKHPCTSTDLADQCPNGEDKKRTLHLGQVKKLIFMAREFLYDSEIVIKDREDISAESTTLMSSLFQYQSDNDGLVGIAEATEFAVGVFSIATLGEELFDKVKMVCESEDPNNIDKWGRIKVQCFRTNFYNIFWADRDVDQKSMREYMPKLYLAMKDLTTEQEIGYTLSTERFTRPCKGEDGNEWEDIPISRNDVIGMLGGLYNVEVTINRWDQDGNNVMNKDEVDLAYNVYQPAVKGIIEDMEMKEWIKKIVRPLHKQIFLYLIKHKQVPETKGSGIWKFIGYLVSFNWKAEANRETIMAILRALSLNSKAFRNSTFDCNTIKFPPEP